MLPTNHAGFNTMPRNEILFFINVILENVVNCM